VKRVEEGKRSQTDEKQERERERERDRKKYKIGKKIAEIARKEVA
jgi:hypothetical protein